MVDKKPTEEERGEPTAGGEGWTKLSEFYPYGDAPPRLSAGLNDTLTDASETAVFTSAKKARFAPNKPKDKPVIEAEGASMEAPQRDEVADPYQAEVVLAILDWVARRLDRGLSAAWLSQIGQMMEWAPDGGPEEEWAQVITELFLGTTYSGPGATYDFGLPQTRSPGGALVSVPVKGFEPYFWDPSIYRRLERRQWQRQGDLYGLQAWDNPVLCDKDADEPNTDPAIPIGVACQHLSTYAVLTRGIPLDAMGNGSAPAAGLMASEHDWGMPLYGGSAYSRPALGKSDKLSGFRLPRPTPKPKADAPEKEEKVKPEDTVAYYVDAQSAIAAGAGPGTIAVYDTDRGTETAPPQLYMTEYELKKYGTAPITVYGKYFKTRKSVEDKSDFADWTKENRAIKEATTDAQEQQKTIDRLEPKATRTKPEDEELAKAKATLAEVTGKMGTDKGPRTPVPYPGPRQYDGSHIYVVLRKHPTKPQIQLLDVSATNAMATLALTGSEGIMFEQGDGIVDGSGKSQFYDLNKAFAGLGVLPPHRVDQAQVDFLRTARPVGLGRLAITRRGKTSASVTANDILYVSRMMRLYGDDRSQNYTVARLLWSLRNTPGFTNVQVWWCLYTPIRLLAKAMWAHGARSMRLSDFAAKYRDIGAGDVKLSIVVTNLGLPPHAGRATLYCRFKTHPVGGTTVGSFAPKDPPSALLRYVDPGRRGLAWNASYAHPKIGVDEGKLPTMFQAGG